MFYFVPTGIYAIRGRLCSRCTLLIDAGVPPCRRHVVCSLKDYDFVPLVGFVVGIQSECSISMRVGDEALFQF